MENQRLEASKISRRVTSSVQVETRAKRLLRHHSGHFSRGMTRDGMVGKARASEKTNSAEDLRNGRFYHGNDHQFTSLSTEIWIYSFPSQWMFKNGRFTMRLTSKKCGKLIF